MLLVWYSLPISKVLTRSQGTWEPKNSASSLLRLPWGNEGLGGPPTPTVGVRASLTSSPGPPATPFLALKYPPLSPLLCPLATIFLPSSPPPSFFFGMESPIKPLPVTPPPPPRLACPCPQALVPEGHELEGRWAALVLLFLADRIWSPLGPALALLVPASPGPFLLY